MHPTLSHPVAASESGPHVLPRPTCRRGHTLTLRNIYRDPRGRVRCRACRREEDQARRPVSKRTCISSSCAAVYEDRSMSPYCPACRAALVPQRVARRAAEQRGRVCPECGERLPLTAFRVSGYVASGERAYHDRCDDCRGGATFGAEGSPAERAQRLIETLTGESAAGWSSRSDDPANVLHYAVVADVLALRATPAVGWRDADEALAQLARQGRLAFPPLEAIRRLHDFQAAARETYRDTRRQPGRRRDSHSTPRSAQEAA